MLNYEKIAEEKNRNRFVSGFTLIELLIVVAIILILVAILTIRFTGYSDRAREASTKSSLNSMQTIVESYASDEGNGKYPLASNDATNTSSVASVMQSHGINWTGDSKGITDPWKTPYRYNSNDNGYIIVSAGKDKTFGTSDDIYVGSYTDGIQNGVPSSSQNSNLVIDINYIMQHGAYAYDVNYGTSAYMLMYEIPRTAEPVTVMSNYPDYDDNGNTSYSYVVDSSDNSSVCLEFSYIPSMPYIGGRSLAVTIVGSDTGLLKQFLYSDAMGNFYDDIKFTISKDVTQYTIADKNNAPPTQ